MLFAQADFVPREVRVQNLCPFRCSQEDQMSRQDAIKLGTRLLNCVPEKYKHLVSMLPPGRKIFRITFRIVGGTDSCNVVANVLRNAITKEQITVPQKSGTPREPTVSIQQSQARTKAFSMFFKAKDAIKDFYKDDTKWDFDTRGSLAIFTSADEQIGKYNDDNLNWEWNHSICTKIGFTPPEDL